MLDQLVTIQVEDGNTAAPDGLLGRYPQGVSFARLPYKTRYPSPVYVWPKQPRRLYRHPLGFDAWFEAYRPTANQMKRALVDLAAMADLNGSKFLAAVDAFERQHGPLAEDARYTRELHSWFYKVPTYIDQTLDDQRMLPFLPLWCYRHESRQLNVTLEMYRAILDGDVDALGDWEWSWHRLMQRVHPYLAFVRYGTDWQEHVDDIKASSPDDLIPYLPKQQLMADNLLGAIYTQVLQVVLGKQLVRRCASSTCNNLFAPSRSDKLYCSTSCANAERVRRYRERQNTKG